MCEIGRFIGLQDRVNALKRRLEELPRGSRLGEPKALAQPPDQPFFSEAANGVGRGVKDRCLLHQQVGHK